MTTENTGTENTGTENTGTDGREGGTTAGRDEGRRTAIVTGGSRGIGRAIALALARQGADVAITYANRAEQADDAAAAVRALGRRALTVRADSGDEHDVLRVFDETEAELGPVDVVVLNVGTSTFGPIADLDVAEFDRVFALNTRGTFLGLREAARRVRDGGRIVAISTGGTSATQPGVGAYVASKAAVELLAVTLAKELGPRGVTVNTVSPGVTRTDGLVMDPAQVDAMVAATPLGRLGDPEDVADVVAFLAGESGRWMTGQRVVAAGGLV